jgi:hypothetical protein
MNAYINSSCDSRVQEVSKLTKEILGENILEIKVEEIKFSENFETTLAKFEAKALELCNKKIKKRTVIGQGVGFIDACFDSLIKAYEENYNSLDSISIANFVINAHLEAGNKRKSDAHVTVLLRIKNANDFEYTFTCTSLSVSKSCVFVIQHCIAFFINAEEAFKKLHFALKDAQERSRSDLIERYKNQMSTLVHATSYENLVLKLKSE